MASLKVPMSNDEAFTASSVPDSALAAPKQITAIASVTSGPATATRNSTPGRVGVALELGHAAEQP